MALLRGHGSVVGAITLVGILLTAATVYAAASALGFVSITHSLYFTILSVLTLANALLLFAVWRKRKEFGPLTHIGFILWGGTGVWYWTFAAFYYVLNMNLSQAQLAWTSFAFLWEVPVIGGGMLTTIGVLMFRPIAQAVASSQPPADPLKIYMQVVRYPRRIASLLFCLSFFGYILGAIQLSIFAAMPTFEIVKSMLNGPVVAIFLAVFYYLTLDTYLDRYRRQLAFDASHEASPVRSLRLRLAIVSLAVLLGSVGLLSLLIVDSFQEVAERRLRSEMRMDLDVLRTAAEQGPAAALAQYGRGAAGFVAIVSQENIRFLPLARETRLAIASGQQGVVRDLYEQGKMIAFTRLPDGQHTVISVAYLTSFYDFLQLPEVANYGLGSLLVIVLTMAVFMFVVVKITQALVSLRSFAKDPELSRWNQLEGMHTGDEIEAVGRTFLRYVQKAKEIDEVRQQFVTIASHKLRTPLTSIRGYTDLLLSQPDGSLTADQQESLKRIDQSTVRMTRLVNDFLNVSQIDSDRLTIRPKETPLAEFVQQVIHDVAKEYKDTGCSITVDSQVGTAAVWVDQALLRKAIQNILTNAIIYRSHEHACEIAVKLSYDEAKQFLISIQDNGVGIPRAQQHRVFDKFFRADNVLTLDTEGTGLGLYVSRMFLKAAGCSISFVSQEGLGTTFYIAIPTKGMLAKPGDMDIADSTTPLNKPLIRQSDPSDPR